MKKLLTLAIMFAATPAFANTPVAKKTTKKTVVAKKVEAKKVEVKKAASPTTKATKKAPATEPPLYSIDSAAKPAPPAKTALARILRAQHLRVCVRSDVPPFGYFTNKGLTGFDISLATELAKRISIDYKKNLHIGWTVITAGARITSLQQKTCDIVIAAFSYTKSRAKLVSFSKIYLLTDKVLVAAANLTRKTPVIARVKGTTGKLDIKGEVRYYNNYQEIINAMEEGTVDYVIADRPIALHMIRSVTRPFNITKTLSKNAEHYAVGMNKGDTHLLKAVNSALSSLAQSGRLTYLHRQWL
ncbi:MAG: hypothetical protein CL920_02890 [Deltaproteobacteria bacterium]|nr:hypothetical protein [Deltaproteobacteria bacterium]|tara:strand:- start:2497 stop:3399 length:903 start_codon:yes stop_codon:yes gene_type:complete